MGAASCKGACEMPSKIRLEKAPCAVSCKGPLDKASRTGFLQGALPLDGPRGKAGGGSLENAGPRTAPRADPGKTLCEAPRKGPLAVFARLPLASTVASSTAAPRAVRGRASRSLAGPSAPARPLEKGPCTGLSRALARLLVDMPRPGAQGRALCEAGAAAPSPGVHRHRSHSLDGMHPIRTGSHAAARGPLTTRKTRRGARIGSKTMAAKKDRHDDRARRGDLDYGLRFWRLNYSGSRRRAVWKNAEDRLQGQRARPSRGHSWGRLETVPSNARKTSLEDRLKGRLDDGSSF